MDCIAEKGAHRAPQVGVGGSGGAPVAGRGNVGFGALDTVFAWGIVHSGKAVSWQALSKVTKVTLLFTRRILYT